MNRAETETRLRRDLDAISRRIRVTPDDAWDRLSSALVDGHGAIDRSVVTEPSEAIPPRRRQMVLVGLVATLVVVAFLVGRISDVDRPETESTPAIDDAALRRDSDHVASMTEAFNAGDREAWARHFAPGAFVFGASLGLEVNDDHYARFFALGSRIELTGGCEALPDATPRRRLRCPVRHTDEFHGAAGLAVVDNYVINFEDDLIRRMVFESTPTTRGAAYIGDYVNFDLDFWLWLLEVHPGVAETYVDVNTPVDEVARIELDHVDEFLADTEIE